MRKNPNTSLTAAIRVFLMLYFRAATTEEGHMRAGHGNFSRMIGRARMIDIAPAEANGDATGADAAETGNSLRPSGVRRTASAAG